MRTSSGLLPHSLLDLHAARRVAHRARLEAVGGAIEQLGHTAFFDVLAVAAAVARMMRRRHVIEAAHHTLEVAIDDRVAIVAEDEVRHQRDLPTPARRVSSDAHT